jgi:hypothetical protein
VFIMDCGRGGGGGGGKSGGLDSDTASHGWTGHSEFPR